MERFVRTSPDYYSASSTRSGLEPRFTPTFNLLAGLFGPGLVCRAGAVVLGAAVPDCRDHRLRPDRAGLFGDLAAEAMARGSPPSKARWSCAASSCCGHRKRIGQGGCLSAHRRIAGRRHRRHPAKPRRLPTRASGSPLGGLALLHGGQGGAGNRGQHGAGGPVLRLAVRPRHPVRMPVADHRLSAVFMALITAAAMLHYSFPGSLSRCWPTSRPIRISGSASSGSKVLCLLRANGEALFDFITYGIRCCSMRWSWSLSDPLDCDRKPDHSADMADSGRAHGDLVRRVPGLHGAAGLLGKGDDHAGAAGHRGLPVDPDRHSAGHVLRTPAPVLSFIQPIMDFMQTMPAFVFMIPVIAFFGTGKPAAVVTTMIFGGTPVVRLTVLGLRGVPEQRARGGDLVWCEQVVSADRGSTCRWPARRSGPASTRRSCCRWPWWWWPR
jgi:glycine betaine/proline transport system permease protein